MFNELALQIEKHLAEGDDFAIAQVVDRIAPSSGKVGDKAIILETGELIGWIGGGCVRGIVIKEALEVIKTKRYRRVRISPEGGSKETPTYKEYVMSCQSKGTVEIMIEPVIPQPELIVVGKSNIARKLVQLASAADFRVTVMASDADVQMFPSAQRLEDHVDFSTIKKFTNTYIIVTTQGEDDELSVKKALETNAKYVGFVASAKKSDDIKTYLTSAGIPEERINQLRSPVGIDINAKLASEVAISILADVIADFRKANTGYGSRCESEEMETAQEPVNEQFAEDYYINPVCGVPVSKKNPKHVIEYKDEKVYFCCDGCKVSFEKNPEQYMNR
ncbi:YHS domain-containing protein [Robertkochia marina]|uniref:YHS domain-containing protein n=1 Tax=Robertkochia marina TaxID=1227945 RepID=A0A4S3M1B5_9FLAO|nr:XdhC family protein [Robertkochia marina]THD68874.1 YHS domain-containing protein [Robertkochia marina]TRZ41120.1 YHS domain-containing protein [Robertkochia marina]